MKRTDKTDAETITKITELKQENAELLEAYKKSIVECAQLQKLFQAEKENLLNIFDSSPVCMLILDENINIVRTNRAAKKLIGSQEEILNQAPGNTLNCIHSSKDRRGCGYSKECKLCPIRNSLEALVSDGKPIMHSDQLIEVSRNGKPQKVWLEICAEKIFINRRPHLCVTLEDLSVRKGAIDELHKQKELLTIMGTTAKVGAWEFDTDTLSLTWTDEVYHIHELDQTFDLDVTKGINFYAQSSRPIMAKAIEHIIATGEPFDLELELITSTGKVLWVRSIGKALKIKGIVTKVYGSIQDITDRKQDESEIFRQNMELKNLNATKDKFFSIISHDLRSPFNSLLGISQLMSEDASSLSDSQIKQSAKIMHKSVNNLFRLLENLLNWARMQQESIAFNPKKVRIKTVISECVAAFNQIAINKGIKMSVEASHNLKIIADSNMLQAILRNLISNALKFTQKGGIVTISATANNEKGVDISISDNGIGMSRKTINNLFRIDEDTKRDGTDGEPSTGLGLILCKEFINKHEGKISVESKKGKGSIFMVSLPANL